MDLTEKNKKLFKFLFYDYETFGKNPALDKPCQFSCIETDINFNIVGSTQEFFCSPPYDYLPDPNSVLITGISPKYTILYGINEFFFAKKIYNLFMQKNICIVGYNNIYFDDEFTRNIFYRNFFDPYSWCFQNGNSRWDILDVLRTCYVLRPEGIKWPVKLNNVISLKLSDVSIANNIMHNNIHNSSSDVYATIQIAKLIQQKQSKLFNFFFKHRTKKSLLEFVNINNIEPILYISRFFGTINNYFSFVVPILWHPKNSNILISIDLSKDIQSLLVVIQTITVTNVNYKQMFSMGIIFIYINRCPMLAPISVIRLQDSIRLRINYQLYKKNLFLLKNCIFLKKNIKIFFNQNTQVVSSNDSVDLQIYRSFFNYSDKKLIKSIQKCLPARMNINFCKYDDRIKKLLEYCIARNYPCQLSGFEKKRWICHYLKIVNYFNVKQIENIIFKLLQQYKNNFYNVLVLQELLKYIRDLTKIFFKVMFN